MIIICRLVFKSVLVSASDFFTVTSSMHPYKQQGVLASVWQFVLCHIVQILLWQWSHGPLLLTCALIRGRCSHARLLLTSSLLIPRHPSLIRVLKSQPWVRGIWSKWPGRVCCCHVDTDIRVGIVFAHRSCDCSRLLSYQYFGHHPFLILDYLVFALTFTN